LKDSAPQLLLFADIVADPFPCYPITQHIAEKLHAILKPPSVENSRLKDLIDILLLAGLDNSIQADRLHAAVEAVFNTRVDAVPAQLGQFPPSWQTRFSQISPELDLPYENLDQARAAAAIFADPILAGKATGVWKPELWKWEAGM